MPDQYVTVLGQQIAKFNAIFQGRPEWELLLRHHRMYFFRYRKDLVAHGSEPKENERRRIDDRRASLVRECTRDLRLAGIASDEAKQIAEHIDDRPVDFEAYVDGMAVAA